MNNELRSLPVELTKTEVDAYGRMLGDKIHELTEVQIAKSTAAAQFKGDIDRLEAQAKLLGRKIHTGIEDREVECLWEPVYSTGIKELRRVDTMAVVETRPLTEQEKQRSLI